MAYSLQVALNKMCSSLGMQQICLTKLSDNLREVFMTIFTANLFCNPAKMASNEAEGMP